MYAANYYIVEADTTSDDWLNVIFCISPAVYVGKSRWHYYTLPCDIFSPTYACTLLVSGDMSDQS